MDDEEGEEDPEIEEEEGDEDHEDEQEGEDDYDQMMEGDYNEEAKSPDAAGGIARPPHHHMHAN